MIKSTVAKYWTAVLERAVSARYCSGMQKRMLMTRREIKTRAKQTVKRHYMILVMTGLIAVFLGLQVSSFDNVVRMYSSERAAAADVKTGAGAGGETADMPPDAGEDGAGMANAGEEAAGMPNAGEEAAGMPNAGGEAAGIPNAGEEADGMPGQADLTDTRVAMGSVGLVDVVEHILMGDHEKGRELSEKLREAEIERSKEGSRVLGRSRGAFSKLVNGVTSGSFIVMFVSGINSLFGTDNLGSLILIMLALAGVLGFYLLVVNTYMVISARMFLESRCYEKLPIQRFVFLLRIKRWIHVSMAMLVYVVYKLLWAFTVVGGIIKSYSYYLVPYILAENPDIGGREAITISRRMMRGHKWECFVMECSFLGWNILGAFTFGLTEIFYSIPYQSAAFCEYYAELRKQAKKAGIPGAELLNDTYLYEKASGECLEKAYADVVEWKNELKSGAKRPEGIRRALSDWFGIFLESSKEERFYEENREIQVRLGMCRDVVEGRVYPGRLSRFPETVKQKRVETFHYMRHYSVWSLIMLFFLFSIFGWCWEVSIHLVLDGMFVNRGTLHGPWLPIYGAGGVLLLTLLNRLRSRPVIEFFSIIFLCGMVEYWTSYYLEVVYDGKKWWDYSGYFLNLNGRICAEGLLVFGIGGMVIVYIAAPLLDNCIQRIPKAALVWCCVVLVCLYVGDGVYSAAYPNEGKGITDYQPVSGLPGNFCVIEALEKRSEDNAGALEKRSEDNARVSRNLDGRSEEYAGDIIVSFVCIGSCLYHPVDYPVAQYLQA